MAVFMTIHRACIVSCLAVRGGGDFEPADFSPSLLPDRPFDPEGIFHPASARPVLSVPRSNKSKYHLQINTHTHCSHFRSFAAEISRASARHVFASKNTKPKTRRQDERRHSVGQYRSGCLVTNGCQASRISWTEFDCSARVCNVLRNTNN